MNTKLSFTAITTYTTCGYKYYLRYRKNYRGKYFHAPLAFGSAIDTALNKLLLTKSLEESKSEFDKAWSFQWVNKQYVPLSHYPDLVYAETDFDTDLLHDEDKQLIEINTDDHLKAIKEILELKRYLGWDNLSTDDKSYYNYANWLCMRRKGHIMLESYASTVLPKIKSVLCLQKENYLTNQHGDKILQYLDLIVRWEDDRVILFDNKTSAKEYESDSAARSPQLLSYYHGAKDEFKIDAIGFLVLRKGIIKNKIKICSHCGFNGSSGRHKTCPNMINDNRCGHMWVIETNPECQIQIIINNVHQSSEQVVLEAFDHANQGIKKENWYRNLSACRSSWGKCEFDRYCWHNDSSEIVDLNEVKKDSELG